MPQNILPPMPETLLRNNDLPKRTVWIDGKRLFGARRIDIEYYPISTKLRELGLSETPAAVVVIGDSLRKAYPVPCGDVWIAHRTSVKQVQAEVPAREGLDNFTKLPAPEILGEDPSNNIFYSGYFGAKIPKINDAPQGVEGSDGITFTTEIPEKPFNACISPDGKDGTPTEFEIVQGTIFTDPQNTRKKTLLLSTQGEILQIESPLLNKL